MDCRTPMRRMDSGVTEAQVCKDDYTFALKVEGVRLVPGANDVVLKAKVSQKSFPLSRFQSDF